MLKKPTRAYMAVYLIPPITRCCFDEQILHEAVMFILSKDNVTPISWGTKQIKLSDACLCLYFKYEEHPIDKDGVTSTTGSAVRYTVYCDQILESSNKQDGLAVLSILEAFLKQLSVELPHIRTVTLQSDNAGCYQAKELLLLIAILNTSSQIRIVRF